MGKCPYFTDRSPRTDLEREQYPDPSLARSVIPNAILIAA